MTKVISMVVLTAFLLTSAGVAFAATTPQSVPVSATVGSAFALNMTIKEETGPGPTFGAEVSAMDFGTLTNEDPITHLPTTNALRGKAFHVWLGPVANGGTQYTVTSTMSALSGPVALPHSIGLFEGTAPATGTIGFTAAGEDAVGPKTIFTSNAAGSSATIELVYGYSGGLADGSSPFSGWQATPPDQQAGTYTSTLVYTLTA